MKHKIIGVIAGAMLLVPGVAFASTLTAPQVSAIIGLLQAFGVSQSTIDIVYADLTPRSATTTPSEISTTTPPSDTTQPSAPVSQPAPATIPAPQTTGVEQPAPAVPSCTLTYVETIPPMSVHLRFTLTNTQAIGYISGIDGVGNMRQMYNLNPLSGQKPYQGFAGNALVNDTYGYEYGTSTVYTLATNDTSCQATVPDINPTM